MDKIVRSKNTIHSVQAAEIQYKGSFTQQRLFLFVFTLKMLQPGERSLHGKRCEKLRYGILASEILTRILITAHVFKFREMRMYQMKALFEGF